ESSRVKSDASLTEEECRMKAALGRFGLAGLAALFVVPWTVRAEEPKAVVGGGVLAKIKLDVGKGAIERPTEGILAGTRGAPAGSTPPAVNPKVGPGKVRWHGDFAAARAAAARSGKPVLLFQMMGKLDDQFC